MEGRGSASYVYWELKWAATLIVKQPRLVADTTISGSPFQSGMVL